jgi:low temperature requirement protein LtrA
MDHSLRHPLHPASAETRRALSKRGQVTIRVVPTDIRVSSIELFFDLVFVFAITQLTGILSRHASVVGVVQVLVN